MKTLEQMRSTNDPTELEWARRKLAEREMEARALNDLPGVLPVPTISNGSMDSWFGVGGAWVSFRKSYGDHWNASWIFEQLEEAGYEPVPASLVKWDNYRDTEEPGLAENIPPTKGRYELKQSKPILPVWFRVSNYTGAEVQAFYRAPAGYMVKVQVDWCGPGGPVHVFARRVEFLGGWRYDSGSKGMRIPGAWRVLVVKGEPIATPAKAVYCMSDQGLDGTLHFYPSIKQGAAPAPSVICAVLESTQ